MKLPSIAAITKPRDVAKLDPKPSGPKSLTQKQEAFCINMVNPEVPSLVEAFRASYNTKNMSKNSQYIEVNRLLRNPRIARRIEELMLPVHAKTTVMLDECVTGFRFAAKLAKKTKNAGALTGAVRELGKISDLYPKIDDPSVNINIVQEVSLTRVELARRMANIIEGGAEHDDDD
jgi:hypothetical protein